MGNDVIRRRQEALYSFLLAQGNNWTSMRAVADGVDLYPPHTLQNFHNSTARRWITKDIEEINASPDFSMIIISTKLGVKLATEDEFTDFLRAEYAEIFKKLKRVRAINRKATNDEQLDIEGEAVKAFLEVG